MTIKALTLAIFILALSGCGNNDNSAQTTTSTGIADQAVKSDPRITTKPSSPVTIFVNANIYTVNKEQPTATAVAIQEGKIIAVGSTDEIRSAYQIAKVTDLKGLTLIPGFIDAHGHLLGLGQSILDTDLVGTTNKSEIIQRLKKNEKNLQQGDWLVGRGWDQNDWPEKALPTKTDLDSAFPSRPVLLERIDGHAIWANTAAMALIDKDLNGDWQIDGGEIVRNTEQQATGVFIDNAATLVTSKMPVVTDQKMTQALQTAMLKTASVGLTSMHDAGTSLRTWKLLKTLDAEEKLAVRVYAMADGANEMLEYLCENGQQIDESAMLTARSIKLYSDGALGSRGAALLEDYSDAPGNKGLLIESAETLTQYANKAANCGLQVNIHAIGDRGNRVTLDALTQVDKISSNPGRHRIEHSQVIAEQDFQRFKSLNLIASVQPTHATSDMYWAEDRVGSERIKGAYAWQTFRELGIPLALGSDFPVERPDPLHGFYAAITRQDHEGWPDKGWHPDQSLTRQEALHGFTLGAAFAAFQEQQLGSIEVGKFADFTLLSHDIMKIPAEKILETKVRATYINGKQVFSPAG